MTKIFGKIFFICLIFSILVTGLVSQEDIQKEEITESQSIKTIGRQSKAIQKDAFSAGYKEIYKDSDFTIAPFSQIKIKLAIMEVTPTSTRIISSPEITVLDGESGELMQGKQNPDTNEIENGFSLKITPNIIQTKGIQMKISYQYFPHMKSPKIKTIQTKNYEDTIMELWKHKRDDKKLVIKMTPQVIVIAGAQQYPKKVTKIRLNYSFLMLNNELISRRPSSVYVSSESGEVFIFLLLKGKGAYILAFKKFKGAHATAVANSQIIRFKSGEDQIELVSLNPILPPGKWLVWVRHNPNYVPAVWLKKTIETSKDFSKGYIGVSSGKAWKTFFK